MSKIKSNRNSEIDEKNKALSNSVKTSTLDSIKKYNSNSRNEKRKQTIKRFQSTNEINLKVRRMIRKMTIKNYNNRSALNLLVQINDSNLQKIGEVEVPLIEKCSSNKNNVNLKRTNSMIIYSRNFPPGIKKAFSNQDILNSKKDKDKEKGRKLKKTDYTMKYLQKGKIFSNQIKEDINSLVKRLQKHKIPNLKSSTISKEKNFLKPLQSQSIFIKREQRQKNLIKRLLSKKKLSGFYLFRKVVKWEGVRKLWLDHRLILEHFLKDYYCFKSFFDNHPLVTLGLMKEFIHLVNLEVRETFYDDLFAVFSDNATNTINVNVFFTVLFITSENSTYEKKVLSLCNICEKLNTNKIYYYDLTELIKRSLYFKNDYIKVDILLKEFYCEREYVEKDNIYNFAVNNVKVRSILERNFNLDLDKINRLFNGEIFSICDNNIRAWRNNISQHGIQSICPAEVVHFEKSLLAIEKKKKDTIELKKNTKAFFLPEH